MSRYPLNQPIRLSTTVKDVTGTLVNPGTLTLVVQIANADGTSTITGTYSSPVMDSTGMFHQDIPATDLASIGHYQYTWTSTGTGAGVSFGDFNVFDPFEVAVLPIQDAKAIINLPLTDTSMDDEIQSFIATIETSIEGYTGGPIVNRTISNERQVLDASYTVLLVRQRPLVSVTSIVSVASGEPIDISAFGGLDLDPNAGTIRRKLGYPFYGPYFTWLPSMYVTYVAGWGTTVPAAITTAAKIIFQHMWTSHHGPATRPQMGPASPMVTIPGFGFAVPNMAAELLNGTVNGMPLRQEAFI